jgi:sugar/nucleoside kinase (ribokinase family)
VPGRLLVSGLINIETTLRIDGFPLPYFPVCYPFFGLHTTVSGVGYNVAKALATLGHEVRFLSLVGRDAQAQLVAAALQADGIPGEGVLNALDETPQSVILYDGAGRRQIHVDLKDIQERPYPLNVALAAADGCALAAVCNINFSRPLLDALKQRGVLIATDVHALADLEDPYDRDFMAAADILFMSHERLPADPAAWAHRVVERYRPQVLVIGLGAGGALLAVPRDGFFGRLPALVTRPIVNTIGAGDALFASFLHAYDASRDPYDALRQATLFASYKIGTAGAAEGFLTDAGLAQLDGERGRELAYITM